MNSSKRQIDSDLFYYSKRVYAYSQCSPYDVLIKMAELSNGAVTLSADDDLDVAWGKTIEYCQKVAKWNLKLNRNITVDQVVSQIRPAPKDPELYDKAEAVFSKALSCLQRFGSIVAQATSAVSILVQVSKYLEIF